MPISPGTRFGSYQVADAIGSGGMGEVYCAHDTELARDVAIKVLSASFTIDAARVVRFEQEAKTLASLNHPNIAQIYGLARKDGTTALVMELVEGPTLAERIAQGPIPVDETLNIAMQIADALEAAHDRGIVHRDLKPTNIKLKADGAVKVLDFGIAKALDVRTTSGQGPAVPTTPALTEAGILLGTAAFMSPEQARGKPIDERTDIWALGCVLYEMLTGQPAFLAEDVTSTLARVLERQPDFSALPAAVSPALRRTLELCLAKEPRKRIADIRDVRLALSGALVVPDAGQSERASRQVRKVVTTGAVLAALSLAAAAWFSTRPAAPPPETHLEISTPPSASPDSFAVSPDGRRVVYTATVDGKTSLWLRSLDTGSAALVSGTEDAFLPFWSPDGRAVAFFKDGKLEVVDTGSGAMREVAEAINGAGGSWGALDDMVFAPSGVGNIFRVSSKGGEPAAVTQAQSTEVHRFPSFLPNGRDFLFFVRSPDESAIYAARPAEALVKRLVDADRPGTYAAGHVFFIRQGKLFALPFNAKSLSASGEAISVQRSAGGIDEGNVIAVSVSASGVVVYRAEPADAAGRRLAWFDRTGAEILTVAAADSSFALAPDEQHLAIARVVGGDVDLWTIDQRRGVASRVTTDPAIDAHPLYVPDGQRIIYQRLSKEGGDIVWRPASGGEEEVLVADGRGNIPTDVSRDGRLLLFKARSLEPGTRPGESWDIWAMPLSGDRKPFPVVVTPFNETDGQFSPDGAWLLYQSDESSQYEVYLQPFGRSGERVVVSLGGGVQPRWRADGREIFYVALDGRLMTVPVERNKEAAGPPRLGRPQALFATKMGRVVNTVARQQYVPAPDGQRFLMSVPETTSASPLRVILNFNPAARRG